MWTTDKKNSVCTTLLGNSIPVSEFESVSFDFDSCNLKRRVLYTEWALIPAGDSRLFRLSVVFVAAILFTSATLIWFGGSYYCARFGVLTAVLLKLRLFRDSRFDLGPVFPDVSKDLGAFIFRVEHSKTGTGLTSCSLCHLISKLTVCLPLWTVFGTDVLHFKTLVYLVNDTLSLAWINTR
jgi:hypothetical protein